MITKEYKEQLEEKQKARELHAISQQHGMGSIAKDLFNKTPFLLNDMAISEEEIAEIKSQEFEAYIKVHDKKLDMVTGSNYTKPKKKRK